jgi:hypothetical protein
MVTGTAHEQNINEEQEVGSTMTNIFGATSTTEDVLSGIDLRGKRILVTGVPAGLGIETARGESA